ncbi:Aste57867_24465 [Aphanomyces stellatus]|uniref:Aste57867_24465 protein n=1 Tax=Aphanomyces stellatus TaxID=120398 RepID=A0A485LRJ4_9STRA|nr:hypothetical protein As57867_024389 [Aphanomyces stellatus]VFU01104.1 Aste57867_24465 [Aphanomyces stellatus]
MEAMFNREMYFKLAGSSSTFSLLADHEFLVFLQEIQANPSHLEQHKTDRRMVLALKVLESAPPSMDAVSTAFDPRTAISLLATNPATVPLLQSFDFFPKLMVVQNDVSTLPEHMSDPRMGKALVALLQATVYATACPVIGSVAELVDYLIAAPDKEWPLWGPYVLVSNLIKRSGHPIFLAKNTQRPNDSIVVKLSHGRREIDFFSKIYNLDKVAVENAVKGFVSYIGGDEVQFRCQALIMERLTCTGLQRRTFLQENRLLRYDFVNEVVRAVQGCHNLRYIHGDIKLENVMFFVDPVTGASQYKLIDFDNATEFGKVMVKHCTHEYCPPELADFMLGTAVLMLKLCTKGEKLVEFAQLNPQEILEAISAPGFSFKRSLDTVTLLNEEQKKVLAKCLHVDPSSRGTLNDYFELLPRTVTGSKNQTSADLAELVKESKELMVRLENGMDKSFEESKRLQLATQDKIIETTKVLLRGFYDATEVKVPTSFIILPYIMADKLHNASTNQNEIVQETVDFLSCIKEIGAGIMSAINAKDPVDAIKALFGNFAQGQPLYFYLLDEVTGEPVQSGKYPIKIDVASDECKKFVATNAQLIQNGFQFLKVANSAAGMLSTFGVPKIDKATMEKIENLLEFSPNSVQDFQVVENALEGEAVVSVRGEALRQLENFLKLHESLAQAPPRWTGGVDLY